MIALISILYLLQNNSKQLIMKNIILIALLFVNISFSVAQVAINENGAAPDSNSILDINSSNKGVLIPRIDLDTSSINANIGTNEIGMMVFNINPNFKNGKGFYYWSGNDWLTLDQNTSIADYDGNNYSSVKMGNKIWMTENLKTTHYSDGTAANHLAYDFNDSLSNIYGYLYKWQDAMHNDSSSNSNPSGVQGICPTGWHLPSEAELEDLINYVGGDSLGGGALKEFGIYHWDFPNKKASNLSKFNALPGGSAIFSQSQGQFNFMNLGEYALFWSCSENDSTHSYCIALYYDYEGIWNVVNTNELYFSIRCVKD